MRLELTIDIKLQDEAAPGLIGRLESWLSRTGASLVAWRVIEDPDPNEEHSG